MVFIPRNYTVEVQHGSFPDILAGGSAALMPEFRIRFAAKFGSGPLYLERREIFKILLNE